jgi:ABC-type Fe3+-hydroxamate transport system substrate-binding protein
VEQLLDELGRPLQLPRRPGRIVSLVPSLTEWLFALGLGRRIVGITEFCTRTGEHATAVRVGGTKNPNRSAILALRPDLVIANREENRERDVVALERAGLAVYVSDPRSVSGAIDTLGRLAHLVDARAAAEPFLRDMARAHALAEARLPVHPRRVLALIWRRPWMAIGADTYAGDLLRLAGGYNVAQSLAGHYPRLDDNAVAALEAELVLLPSEPYPFSESDLPAVREVCRGEPRFVDGELLTWYGPRIPLALEELGVAVK